MKKAFYLAVLFSGALFAQDTPRVLFVGNSYTNYNNLPQLVDDIAISLGDDLIHAAHTPGGNTMQQHSVNTTLMNKLDDDVWNFVVLQAQSQEPSFSPSQVSNDVYPYAANLCDSIIANNSCAEPLFFMTWGRENGDASNCQNYPPICTYDGMQTRLSESYTEMSLNNEASLSPVGEVWRSVRTQFPNYDLYSSDGSHPSLLGSYLSACTFYEIIFQKSCIGASYPSSISSQEAADIQAIVNLTVSQDIATWLGYGNVPFVNPSLNFDGSLLHFNANGQNGTNYEWDFGDGNTSPLDTGLHAYAAGGNYEVNLSYSNSCHSFETSFTVFANLGLEESLQELNIYLENKLLSIQSENSISGPLNIFTMEGKKVHSQTLNQHTTQIDLQGLNEGIYILQLTDGTHLKFQLK